MMFRLTLTAGVTLSLLLCILSIAADAAPFRATSGYASISLDPLALGSLNFGIDPNVPTLVLEHFYSREEAATISRAAILTPPYATTDLPSPQGLVHDVTGPLVPTPEDRLLIPTHLLLDTEHLRSSWSSTELVGLYGVHRFIGDFGVPFGAAPFVWGDFHIGLDPHRNTGAQTGFYVQNNFDIPLPLFDLGQPVISASASSLTLSADLLLSPEVAAAFFFGDDFRRLGTMTLTLLAGDVNLDGTLTAQDLDLIAAGIREHDDMQLLDSTGDGHVTVADHRHWVREILGTYLGDSNLDGEFNSSDLIAVFMAGEYEDGLAGNTGWATGDWNGDGEFSTGDLVDAFTDGGYEQGPRATVAAVPEPSSLLHVLIVIGATACAGSRARHRQRKAACSQE